VEKGDFPHDGKGLRRGLLSPRHFSDFGCENDAFWCAFGTVLSN